MEGERNDYQLASSLHAPFVAQERMLCQQIRLALDLLIQPDGRCWIICGNVIELFKPVTCRGPEPANDEKGVFSGVAELLSQAALLMAL